MSLYRTVLAAVAAVAIASPVFADDNTATQPQTQNPTGNMQVADSSTTTTTTTTTGDQATATKININTATPKELVKVQGLNAAKAKAIVAYRKKHGDFKSTDEIANVKGFNKLNPETLKTITEQLTIQ